MYLHSMSSMKAQQYSTSTDSIEEKHFKVAWPSHSLSEAKWGHITRSSIYCTGGDSTITPAQTLYCALDLLNGLLFSHHLGVRLGLKQEEKKGGEVLTCEMDRISQHVLK